MSGMPNTPALLAGDDFVAVRRLSTKDDETLAMPGERCERVPAASLPALLAAGKIRPAEKKARKIAREEV